MDTTNVKKFRALYNKLDELISERVGIYKKQSFIQKLKKFMYKYPSYEWLKSEIRLIHDLRNVLIHEEKEKEDVAIPTDTFIKMIEGILITLSKPQTAYDISSKKVFGCDPNDKVIDVVKVMAEKIYTRVPVFRNKKDCTGFIGVFSANSLARILVGESVSGTIEDFANKTISDIIESVKTPISESWDFVQEDMDVFKVQSMFQTKVYDNALLEKSRLGVLFVTKSGKRDDRITGLITAWDLSKVEKQSLEMRMK